MTKRLLSSIAALALLATPAYALTAVQVGTEVGGYTCAGSTCTLKTNGAVTVTDPSTRAPAAGSVSHVEWDAKCGPFMHQVAGLCILQEADLRGGGSDVPGATHINPVCNKITAVIGFDPAGGANGFSVTKSRSTTAGAC